MVIVDLISGLISAINQEYNNVTQLKLHKTTFNLQSRMPVQLQLGLGQGRCENGQFDTGGTGLLFQREGRLHQCVDGIA